MFECFNNGSSHSWLSSLIYQACGQQNEELRQLYFQRFQGQSNEYWSSTSSKPSLTLHQSSISSYASQWSAKPSMQSQVACTHTQQACVNPPRKPTPIVGLDAHACDWKTSHRFFARSRFDSCSGFVNGFRVLNSCNWHWWNRSASWYHTSMQWEPETPAGTATIYNFYKHITILNLIETI